MLIVPKIKLDELDNKLIRELKLDSRRSVRQLAKSLNESPSTIYNRVKRLEAKEIIKKWTVTLDYAALNLDTVAFVFVSLGATDQTKTNGRFSRHSIVEQLKRIEGVYEIHFVSGDADILVKIRADSIKSIGSIVMNEIRTLPGVVSTTTNTCFESMIDETDVL
ncbi:MAG: Lrp/AsnC family transcriptional regulator [Candidatus Kariarchaeaceae archaeon]|jgi:DNA-binding Lrp family transcriptional regulator